MVQDVYISLAYINIGFFKIWNDLTIDVHVSDMSFTTVSKKLCFYHIKLQMPRYRMVPPF